ncbi:MAG: tripartite tricarboxylate transporter substrate binding protein [Rhodopseudomonas sp.]|nr:tripartite tricarboxylate transporter substrate binding protein [Rhodopseudomonas sp.]
MKRRQLLGGRWPQLGRRLALGTVLLAATTALTPAHADSYPSKPITIVTPFAAGSVTDATARVIAKFISDKLHQTVIVENRSGAGGMIAANAVARAAPDGYTLLLTTNSTHSAAPGLFKHVPYDPIKDFTPIARIGSFPSIVVANNKTGIHSMAELVAKAKENPGKLSYGHGNSTGQITGETLKFRTKINIVRVPYRSNPIGITDLIGGQIQVMIPDMNTALPQIKAHNMVPLAVLTKQRSKLLPDVPTLDETVMPGFDLLAWAGLFGPADMPPDVVTTIAKQVHAALETEEIKDRFAKSGIEVYWSDPAEFKKFVATELVKWTSLIKEAGIKPE